MARPLLKNLILLLFIASTFLLTHQDCLNLCYSRDSGPGSCAICYYECSHSSQAYFTSCHYENQETSEILDLSENECYSYCYPEMLEELSALDDLSKKLDSSQAQTKPRNSELHKITTQELEEQMKIDEHQTDLIIFAMASACGLLTLLVIIFIVRHFESKDAQKPQQNEAQDIQNQDKDFPDIVIDSSSTFYGSNQKETMQLNL